jgi:predicted acylesterase/phospholipase RssA
MPSETLDKFKTQLKSFKRPLHSSKSSSKIALCLAGGGITGAMYEAGCLAALDDFLEKPCCVNQFDIFVGTSAGALSASLIANGYTAREIFEKHNIKIRPEFLSELSHAADSTTD